MKLVDFGPSTRDEKKFMAVVEDGDKKKTIHFGAKGMSDFTKNGDEERKQRYLDRHKTTEDWSNPLTAGFWSRWILWNKASVGSSLRFVRSKFGL